MLARPARSAVLGRLVAALLVAVASIVLLGSSPAHACRCVFGDVGRQVDRADAVFVGSFDRADRTVADGQISFDVAVDEVYRGQVSPELTVRAPYSSATCGLDGIPAGEPVAWFVRSSPGRRGPLRPVHRYDAPHAAAGPPARAAGRTTGPTGDQRPAGEAAAASTSAPTPSDRAGPAESTGPAAAADSTRRPAPRTPAACSTARLPWWAWTAIGLSRRRRPLVVTLRRAAPHPTPPDPAEVSCSCAPTVVACRPCVVRPLRGTCHPTCRRGAAAYPAEPAAGRPAPSTRPSPAAAPGASARAGRGRPSAGRRSRSGCRGTGPPASRPAGPGRSAARTRSASPRRTAATAAPAPRPAPGRGRP